MFCRCTPPLSDTTFVADPRSLVPLPLNQIMTVWHISWAVWICHVPLAERSARDNHRLTPSSQGKSSTGFRRLAVPLDRGLPGNFLADPAQRNSYILQEVYISWASFPLGSKSKTQDQKVSAPFSVRDKISSIVDPTTCCELGKLTLAGQFPSSRNERYIGNFSERHCRIIPGLYLI